MSRDSVLNGVRNLAALRRLGLVDAATAVTWATEQLASVNEPCDSLVRLASEPLPPDSRVVDELLDELLGDLDALPMNDIRAGRLAARLLAERIVGGSIEPGVGARKIWWDVARRVPPLEPELRVFIGLASEWEDSVEHRSDFDEDIIAAANELLAKADPEL